jgi:hypothetical protein
MTTCTHPANAHMVMPADWTASPRFSCQYVTGHDVGTGRPLHDCPCDTDHFTTPRPVPDAVVLERNRELQRRLALGRRPAK